MSTRDGYRNTWHCSASFSLHRLQNLIPDQHWQVYLLLWLFVRRIALGQLPTALQINAPYAFFHEGSVPKFTYLVKHHPSKLPSQNCFRPAWALADSYPTIPQPANLFKYFSPFFVVYIRVYTMSPRPKYLGRLGGRNPGRGHGRFCKFFERM